MAVWWLQMDDFNEQEMFGGGRRQEMTFAFDWCENILFIGIVDHVCHPNKS